MGEADSEAHGSKAAGPQVWGQRRAGTQAWEVGPLHPHPAPPVQETPQHGVNRRDFPSPQGEAGGWAGSQWGNGPRRVRGLPTCLVLGPGMGSGGAPKREGQEMGETGRLPGAKGPFLITPFIIQQDPSTISSLFP